MSSRDQPPSLADLRRRAGRTRQRPEAFPPAPGLFDFAVDPEPLADSLSPGAANQTISQQPEAPTDVQVESPPPEPPPEPRVWTVAELVRQVRGMVERSYAQIAVEGEISNWRPAASGHCYFTLKGGDAQLSVVLFRRQAALLRFQPKDGDAVRLRGQLSVYESRGQMQLIAEWMEPRGLGALLAAVRELKERLRREGLFDRKRPLPSFPKCIGVVTSVHGAALRDIVKVCRRRHAAVSLLIYPAAVQGPRCAEEVAAGLRWFSRHPERADVVIVARGGGSWEDLHGFDDERVARAIAECTVPVIAGIGHATDSTIADAAADVCAPTPSAAAEIVTAAQHRIEERVDHLRTRLERAGGYELLRARQRYSGVGAEMALRRTRDGIERRLQRFDELDLRLVTSATERLRTAAARQQRSETKLLRHDPARHLNDYKRQCESLRVRLAAAARPFAESRRTRIEHAAARLQALSPLRVLDRGYALVYGPDGRLLRTSSDVRQGEQITARLADGSVRAEVLAAE